MTNRQCDREHEVWQAVREDRWDVSLREHAETCPVCRDVLVTAAWVRGRAPEPSAVPSGVGEAERLWRLSAPLRAWSGPASDRAALFTAILSWAAPLFMALVGLWIFRADLAETEGLLVSAAQQLSKACDPAGAALAAHAVAFLLALAALTALLARAALRRRA
jgi:hypothetical protein